MAKLHFYKKCSHHAYGQLKNKTKTNQKKVLLKLLEVNKFTNDLREQNDSNFKGSMYHWLCEGRKKPNSYLKLSQ